MNQLSFKSIEELVSDLGHSIREQRLSQGFTQATLADKAGISPRALRELEMGGGSTLTTFVSVLKALGSAELLDALHDKATISPMQLLKHQKTRSRGFR